MRLRSPLGRIFHIAHPYRPSQRINRFPETRMHSHVGSQFRRSVGTLLVRPDFGRRRPVPWPSRATPSTADAVVGMPHFPQWDTWRERGGDDRGGDKE